MKKINNNALKQKYIDKYKLDTIFSNDMTEFMQVVAFEKGEFLCRENEPIECICFFVKGKAKVFRTLKNGKSLLISFYYPLTVLGDLEFINGENADANIQAMDESICIWIALNNKVIKLLSNDVRYLRFTCESIGEKLVKTSKNCSINLLYPLESRLASYIIATINKMEDGEIVRFDESLTHVSELLAVSYRHLLRTINSFIERGLLMKKGKYYEVINMKEIKRLSADLYM
ncbi:MAG: cyclic nucleotide-binding domain-containing protein [Clostridiaceae bacterium]|nr:cyclic nucleotide-binding domain-containing protein [Clostridiaceae bacterium]